MWGHLRVSAVSAEDGMAGSHGHRLGVRLILVGCVTLGWSHSCSEPVSPMLDGDNITYCFTCECGPHFTNKDFHNLQGTGMLSFICRWGNWLRGKKGLKTAFPFKLLLSGKFWSPGPVCLCWEGPRVKAAPFPHDPHS